MLGRLPLGVHCTRNISWRGVTTAGLQPRPRPFLIAFDKRRDQIIQPEKSYTERRSPIQKPQVYRIHDLWEARHHSAIH